MPTYAYQCRQCGDSFEIRQRMTDEPLTKCQACENGVLKKLLHAPPVIFNGSGFSTTESRPMFVKGKE